MAGRSPRRAIRAWKLFGAIGAPRRVGPLLTLQAAQGSQFVTLQRMDAWRPALAAADVEAAGLKLDLVSSEIAHFGGPQAMPVGDQDHGGVAVTVAAAFAGRCHERLDLGPRQVLAVRATVEFTMVGAASLPTCESMKNFPSRNVTVEQLVISSTVSNDEMYVSQSVAVVCRQPCAMA